MIAFMLYKLTTGKPDKLYYYQILTYGTYIVIIQTIELIARGPLRINHAHQKLPSNTIRSSAIFFYMLIILSRPYQDLCFPNQEEDLEIDHWVIRTVGSEAPRSWLNPNGLIGVLQMDG